MLRAKEARTGGLGRHTHALDFQLIFVLKGWVKVAYDSEGEVELRSGDSVLQPPGIRHELIAFSADCEVIEVTSPAETGTEDA